MHVSFVNQHALAMHVHGICSLRSSSKCHVTNLLVVDLRSSLTYSQMTHPLPIAGKLPIKAYMQVARQQPTKLHTPNTLTHTTHSRTLWLSLTPEMWSDCGSHAVILHHTARRIGGMRNGGWGNIEKQKWELEWNQLSNQTLHQCLSIVRHFILWYYIVMLELLLY